MQIEIKADKPLLTLLERIANALERYTETPTEVEAPKPEPVKTAEPEPVAAEPVADQPEEVKPTVTLEEIRKKVVQLSAAGDQVKDAVRAIVTEYGRNVSAIPQEKYSEVMGRLNAVKEA